VSHSVTCLLRQEIWDTKVLLLSPPFLLFLPLSHYTELWWCKTAQATWHSTLHLWRHGSVEFTYQHALVKNPIISACY